MNFITQTKFYTNASAEQLAFYFKDATLVGHSFLAQLTWEHFEQLKNYYETRKPRSLKAKYRLAKTQIEFDKAEQLLKNRYKQFQSLHELNMETTNGNYDY